MNETPSVLVVEADPDAAQALLDEWARLHSIRSSLGALAALLFVLALERP